MNTRQLWQSIGTLSLAGLAALLIAACATPTAPGSLPAGAVSARAVSAGDVSAGAVSAGAIPAGVSAAKDASKKTFVCHITDDGTRLEDDGSITPVWLGNVMHVGNSAVAAHCTHGIGDHNPTLGNQGIGNRCGRSKFANAFSCEIDGNNGP